MQNPCCRFNNNVAKNYPFYFIKLKTRKENYNIFYIKIKISQLKNAKKCQKHENNKFQKKHNYLIKIVFKYIYNKVIIM